MMLPGTDTLDLSAVDTLDDTALAAALQVALDRFAAVRVADPRRTSLAYSDAKLAARLLGDEAQRRRTDALVTMVQITANVARTVRELPAPRHPDAGRTAVRTRIGRTGDPFLGAATTDDDEL